MSLLVKICGLRTREAVEAAVAGGADAVGFVFHAPSPRNVEPSRAAALAALLPRGVLRVAVTLHPTQSLVDRVLAGFEPDAWQSDAADFATIGLPPAISHWPVWRSGNPLPGTPPPRLVYEAAMSGAGMRADWTAAAGLARRCGLILGGGLDPANVGAAILSVRPSGVDVSSGVEREPGVKDPAMIRAFIEAARAAHQGVTA